MGIEVHYAEARRLATKTVKQLGSAQATGGDTVAAFDGAIAALRDSDDGVVGQLARIRDAYSASLTRACTQANGLAGALKDNVNLYEGFDNDAAAQLDGLPDRVPPGGATSHWNAV